MTAIPCGRGGLYLGETTVFILLVKVQSGDRNHTSYFNRENLTLPLLSVSENWKGKRETLRYPGDGKFRKQLPLLKLEEQKMLWLLELKLGWGASQSSSPDLWVGSLSSWFWYPRGYSEAGSGSVRTLQTANWNWVWLLQSTSAARRKICGYSDADRNKKQTGRSKSHLLLWHHSLPLAPPVGRT